MMPSNFLKQIILRLDLLGEIKLSQQVVDNIRRVVSDSFPEFEPREKVLYEMAFEKAQRTTREKRTKAFFFHNNRTNSSLSLDPDAITFDIKDYTNYGDFRDFVQRVIQNLGAENSSAKTSRIGLRYINQIIFNEGNPFDWAGLIKDPLTSNLSFIERQNELSRLIGIIELNRSDYFIKFQYGWFNSEYPNPIAKKEFLLDYDCYSKDETDLSLVLNQVDTYHTAIRELFEYSTLEDLKTIMRGE